jgi:branched-chain amino acid transport system ATP-binding protein/urea transport system ATP-binding protein
MTEAPLLEARRLEKRFGGVRAIAGVDFRLARGELRCLIGPNGAGKSTFFKMLTAQLRPTAGQVLFEGTDITAKEPHEISRHGIGIKNQVPSVFDGVPVREGLWLAAASRHSQREAAAIVEEVLDRLRLEAIAQHLVGTLAHGQRQWAEFGMVMALRPKLILLDEPTAGMSREEVVRTTELIRELNKSATLIVVEHDMQFIRDIATTVTVFHQGGILMEDTMEAVQKSPAVRKVYLGTSSHG